jgi:NADPH:quinone reductase-like Zn-dependent oxidoreductase
MSVPITEIEECPSFLSDEEAAATPLAALTAWRATIIKAAIRPGDQILITGIGGGVAIFCLQLAVAYGAKVYVTSGDEEKLRKAKDLGAVGGVNYKDPKWASRLAEMLPGERGWLDSVIDSAGGDIVKESLRLLRYGGVISSYGMTLGPNIMFPMQAVMKNIEVCRKISLNCFPFLGHPQVLRWRDETLTHWIVQRLDDGLEERIQGGYAIHRKASTPSSSRLSLLNG